MIYTEIRSACVVFLGRSNCGAQMRNVGLNLACFHIFSVLSPLTKTNIP